MPIRKPRKIAPANEVEARELALFTTNDFDLYRQQAQPIVENLAKKLAKGVFDRQKAIVLLGYLADNGAKKYAWNHGGDRRGKRSWEEMSVTMFDAPTRRAAAAEMLNHYMDEVEYRAREIAAKRAAPKSRAKKPAARPNGRRGMTKADAVADFRSTYLSRIDQSDRPGLRAAWNDYVDNLHRGGYITDRQVNTWDQPEFVSRKSAPRRRG